MRKLLGILIGFIMVVSSLVAPVYAQNKVEVTSLSSVQTINGDYFAGNERVVLSGIVNGDAYVGGGDIIFDGTINGDLILGGGNITVEGTVDGNARIAGGNITFSNANIAKNVTVVGGSVILDSATSIGGSVVAAGGNIQLLGPVSKGVTVAGGNVVIGDKVGGGVWSPGVGTLRLGNNAQINGNLTYLSDTQATISEGATISGDIKREIPPVDKDKGDIVVGVLGGIAGIFIFFTIVDFLTILILGLLLIAFFPVYSTKVSGLVKERLGMSILVGLVFFMVTPIVAVIAMITIIGIPLGLFLIFCYMVILWFGRVFAILAFGQFLLSQTKTRSLGWAYTLGVVVYFVLNLIPIIGFITHFVIVLGGVGAFVLTKKSYYTQLRAKNQI